MITQTRTPPSSSPTQFALDRPNSSKRRDNELDIDSRPAKKRHVTPGRRLLKENETGYVSLRHDAQVSQAASQAGNQQLPSPGPSFPGHDQQQQTDFTVSRTKGISAAKSLSKAAIGKSPGGFLSADRCQTNTQLPPRDPAKPPPPRLSTQNQGHCSYTVSNEGMLICQENTWFDQNTVIAASMIGPHHTMPQPPQYAIQNQNNWSYTALDADTLSSQQSPWFDQIPMTIANMSGPHQIMPQPQGLRMSDYGPFQPQPKFPGDYQSQLPIQQPLLGTVSFPINLDDDPVHTTPNTAHAPHEALPQFYPAYSIDRTPFSGCFDRGQAGVTSFATSTKRAPHPSASGSPRVAPYFTETADRTANVGLAPVLKPYSQLKPQPKTSPAIPGPEDQRWTGLAGPQASTKPLPKATFSSFDELVGTAPAKTPKASTPKVPLLTDEPSLCPEQAALVDLIMQGHNVFYTGSAGCGKSTVLKAFVKRLTDMGKTVHIVAPTGRAALNVGGMTTWSFAGWTPHSHKKDLDQLRKEAVWNSKVNKRLKETDVLVIDEISMVENFHFERLNEIMKAVHRRSNSQITAFGGCQIIVTGDFCQLPPVKPFLHCMQCGKELTRRVEPGEKPSYHCRHHGNFADEDKWAFKSRAWGECDFKNVHLRTIHRQNDEPFIRMLQKCRLGSRLTEQEIHLLMHHKNRTSQAMELYPTRKEADDVNRVKFNKIIGETHTYWAHDSFFWHKEKHPNLQWKGTPSEWRNIDRLTPPQSKRPLKALEDHRYNECVQLKRGGLVVLLTNLDLRLGLCNGSQGVICGFEEYDPTMIPTGQDSRDEVSWGKGRNTEKKAEPKPGQRVLRGEHAGIQEREIKNFITSDCAPIKKWPIVRFHNGQKCTIYAECSVTQLGDDEPYSLLARTQLPLAPAWAMTIHKSQSLTLDRVIVNLDRAFEEGQVYVALSRATGLYGLKIDGDGLFLRDKILVNSEVATFLKEQFGDIYDDMDAPEVEDFGSVEAS